MARPNGSTSGAGCAARSSSSSLVGAVPVIGSRRPLVCSNIVDSSSGPKGRVCGLDKRMTSLIFSRPCGSGTRPRPEGVPAMAAWPTEIKLRRDRAALTVSFDNGERYELPAEYLRVKSPSAEVQGHSPDERKTVPGKRNVMVLEVHPIGNYAVRLVFDDMHSTGIYSWDYFLDLGRNQEKYWQAYLDELAVKGLSREPAKRG